MCFSNLGGLQADLKEGVVCGGGAPPEEKRIAGAATITLDDVKITTPARSIGIYRYLYIYIYICEYILICT